MLLALLHFERDFMEECGKLFGNAWHFPEIIFLKPVPAGLCLVILTLPLSRWPALARVRVQWSVLTACLIQLPSAFDHLTPASWNTSLSSVTSACHSHSLSLHSRQLQLLGACFQFLIFSTSKLEMFISIQGLSLPFGLDSRAWSHVRAEDSSLCVSSLHHFLELQGEMKAAWLFNVWQACEQVSLFSNSWTKTNSILPGKPSFWLFSFSLSDPASSASRIFPEQDFAHPFSGPTHMDPSLISCLNLDYLWSLMIQSKLLSLSPGVFSTQQQNWFFTNVGPCHHA